MKSTKRFAALGAAMLAVCLMFTSCSGKVEDTGVAYSKDMKIASVEDLDGKIVAVQLRSEADSYVDSNNLTKYIKRYEDMSNAAKDLVDKKIAAMVVDANYAQKLVADNDTLQIVKGEVATVGYKFAVLKSESSENLVNQFNAQITAIQATERFNALIKAELQGGEAAPTVKEEGKELSKAFTLVADPYFKPFIYKNDNAFEGFFVTIADEIAYACGANLTVKEVSPDSELSALETEENAIAVVSGEVDAEKYDVTETLYTSNLVIVTRKAESK